MSAGWPGTRPAPGWPARGLAGSGYIGADTEVVLEDEVFGKPKDAQSAAAMLRRLSGRVHHGDLGGMAGQRRRRRKHATCVSEVRFAVLDEASIASYVATREPFGKAGAYAIQGRAAAFIEHLQGSYSAVMGLPLFETARLLRAIVSMKRQSGGFTTMNHATAASALLRACARTGGQIEPERSRSLQESTPAKTGPADRTTETSTPANGSARTPTS